MIITLLPIVYDNTILIKRIAICRYLVFTGVSNLQVYHYNKQTHQSNIVNSPIQVRLVPLYEQPAFGFLRLKINLPFHPCRVGDHSWLRTVP
jgi:hypothetical protein